VTDFHEICEEGSAPTLMARFGSFDTTEKHMEDKTHGAIVQKQYRTVVKA
jgi:hypothetical protein